MPGEPRHAARKPEQDPHRRTEISQRALLPEVVRCREVNDLSMYYLNPPVLSDDI